jgi:hypothetical protein
MRFMSFAEQIEVLGRSQRVGAHEQLRRSETVTGYVARASLTDQKLELGDSSCGVTDRFQKREGR